MSAIDTDPAHAGDHGDEDELDHDTLHITVGGYVTGFVLSVILTAIPFWLVMAKVFSNPTVTTFIILGFAIVQIYVHMVFFLHMTSHAEGGWTVDVADLHGRARRHHAVRLDVGDVPPEDQHDAALARADAKHAMTDSVSSPPLDPTLTPRAPPPPAPAVSPGDIAVGVVIGRASEYFDYFVYGIASVLVFPFIFFPFESRLDGTLWSFALFALAFIARPIGSIVFFDIQRRWGRSTKLTLALFVLGTSTVGIAFLPGYGALGYMAIVLLALFRVGQGIALGGSWDGLPSLLALSAPPNRRGWYAMLGQLGAPVGFMIASALYLLLVATLSQEDFLSWGWRYPFFCAFAINVVALFARLRLVVTHEFDELLADKELEPTPTREVLKSQGYNVVLGAFTALAGYALFHVITVFPLSWIMLFSKQSVTGFLAIQILASIVGIVGVLASGVIADKLGGRPEDARLLCGAHRGLQRLCADPTRRRHARAGRLRADRLRLAGPLVRTGSRHPQCELRSAVPLHGRRAHVRRGMAHRRGIRAAGRARNVCLLRARIREPLPPLGRGRNAGGAVDQPQARGARLRIDPEQSSKRITN
jgi:cytochrome o ubiquinol oxidase subunit IV